ncbi:hypothetical protein NFJ02_01g40780 [Pycnococcus provasolii]
MAEDKPEGEEMEEGAEVAEAQVPSEGDVWLRRRMDEMKKEKLETKKQAQRDAQKRREEEKRQAAERKAREESEKKEHEMEATISSRVRQGVAAVIEARRTQVSGQPMGRFQGSARPIFVCYAPEADGNERLFVYRFVRELQRRCGPDAVKIAFDWDKGTGPWAGAAFTASRHELLAAAKVVLCVTSPAFFASEMCQLELAACRHRVVHGALAPECLGNVTRAPSCHVVQVPYQVDKIFRDGAGEESELLVTCDALRITPERPPHDSAYEAAEEVQALLSNLDAVREYNGEYNVDMAFSTSTVWSEAEIKMWIKARQDAFKAGAMKGNTKPIAQWSRFDLQAYIDANGAAMARHCAPLYETHRIDGFVLPHLTDEMARELGVEAPAAREMLVDFVRRRAAMDTDSSVMEESPLSRMSDAELTDYLTEVFRGADKDDSGALDRHEFKLLIREANLGITAKDIGVIMEDVDINNDGEISFSEFVPTMVLLLRAYEAKRAAQTADEAEAKSLTAVAEDLVYRGRSKAQVGDALREIFKEADLNGNGVLDRKEFHHALVQMSISHDEGKNPRGLTRREIRALMHAADFDQDGMIQYEEFVPVALGCLVEQLKSKMVVAQINHGVEWLRNIIEEGFTREIGRKVSDVVARLPFEPNLKVEKAQVMTKTECKKVLIALSEEVLGLSLFQICILMTECKPDSSGAVDLQRFALLCATMIMSFFETARRQRRVAAMEAISQSEGAGALAAFRSYSKEECRKILGEYFVLADENGNGKLEPAELQNLLESLGTSELGLSKSEIQMLQAAIDEDNNNEIEYNEWIDFMISMLNYMESEQKVSGGFGLENISR